jgi:hypothetical protein
VSSAQGASEGALGDVGPLLTTAASAYRRLLSTAMAAGIEVPYEANLSNVGSLVWLEQLLVRLHWRGCSSAHCCKNSTAIVLLHPGQTGVARGWCGVAALTRQQYVTDCSWMVRLMVVWVVELC